MFGNWKYSALMIIIALIFYSINILIKEYSSLTSLYSQIGLLGVIKLFFTFFIGFRSTTFLSVFISIIIISILLGMLISLVIYKIKILQSVSGKMGFFTTAGVFLGVLAPGCAACGVGLLSLFGISAASLSFLPYNGLELSALSSIILLVLVFKITKEINNEIVCKTMKGGKRNE